MITKDVKRKIDRAIKTVWLKEICEDYGNGKLLREASLQSAFYHHLRSYLEDILEDNDLFIYPELYIPKWGNNGYKKADLTIVQMDLSADGGLSERVLDVAAIVELKYQGEATQDTQDVIKADLQKMKRYAKQFENCQCYFGVIYETECEWLYWLDRRSTEHWADGRMTELNAGYLDGVMIFEVNSYNHIGIQNRSVECRMLW